MFVALIKSFEDIEWFVDIPQVRFESDSKVELHWLSEQNRLPIAQDFAWNTNSKTGRLLSIYEDDYYDADNCSVIAAWLNKRLAGDWGACPDGLRSDYELILSLARRAIDLGTGIVIEL